MRFNVRLIISILGLLLMLNGIFMLLCIPVSLFTAGGEWYALTAAGIFTILTGFIAWSVKQKATPDLRKNDGYIVVTLGWVIMSLFGTLPYLISGTIPSFTDAFFETLSGYSTTGATVLTDIESVDKSILLWRSLTQWIGGMGIIVLTVAILPLLGIGGMQLFVAEAPGITPDKLKPRITDTAKRLWLIYVGLTGLEMILLWMGGMTLYDALNHSLTTMATGGFSTKNSSIAFYTSPYIQYVIIVFMFLAGTNFTLTYFFLHGNFKKVFNNEEYKHYVRLTIVVTIVVAISAFLSTDFGVERSFRDALFQVVSVVTTTGYITADYTAYTPFVTLVFFIIMFVGGMAGSTAGGVKIIRHIILFKNSMLELKRLLHPSAIIPVRFNKKAVQRDITFNIIAFIINYAVIFAIGAILLSLTGIDFVTSLGASATCLGNIGPGLGSVGPVDNFAALPAVSKWILSTLMLLGRLELFTVLVLFTTYFWRDH